MARKKREQAKPRREAAIDGGGRFGTFTHIAVVHSPDEPLTIYVDGAVVPDVDARGLAAIQFAGILPR